MTTTTSPVNVEFASDLGLRPGQWPPLIEVQSRSGSTPFRRTASPNIQENEIVSWDYVNAVGERVTVYND